jgi:hypothetical protein
LISSTDAAIVIKTFKMKAPKLLSTIREMETFLMMLLKLLFLHL